MSRLNQFIAECPIIAIIRGVTPSDAVAVGDALYRAGIRVIEVPLNSPRPYVSIELLRKYFGSGCVIGAGTVLQPSEVRNVVNAGGEIIVSPNTDADVLSAACCTSDVTAIPGIFSPTDAILATTLGARNLKLFPASSTTPRHVSALMDVLPSATKIFPVGGIGTGDYKSWIAAGAAGFGIGSLLYKPGHSVESVTENATNIIKCVREACPPT